MCGRIYIPDAASIEREFHLGQVNQPQLLEARYNVVPQQGNPRNFIPVRRQGDGGVLELVPLQWWLFAGLVQGAGQQVRHIQRARRDCRGEGNLSGAVQASQLPDSRDWLV
jgi:hypothetical protein